MTRHFDPYDYILDELEGIIYEDEHHSSFPSDDDLQFLSEEDRRKEEADGRAA